MKVLPSIFSLLFFSLPFGAAAGPAAPVIHPGFLLGK